MHGGGANANWWDFVAPFLTDTYDVVALSNSGNGDSGWRDAYSIDKWAQEVVRVCEHARYFDARRAGRPLVVSHSLGVYVTLTLAYSMGAYLAPSSGLRWRASTLRGLHKGGGGGGGGGGGRRGGKQRLGRAFAKKFAGMILIDGAVRKPGTEPNFGPPPPRRLNVGDRFYHPWQTPPEQRFSLRPPQACANGFVCDYIARKSFADFGAKGWAWKFDPDRMLKWEIDSESRPVSETPALVKAVARRGCRVCFLHGEHSAIVDADTARYMRAEFEPHGVPVVEMPQAAHHLMLDRPLAFVTFLRGTLAGWRTAGARQQQQGRPQSRL